MHEPSEADPIVVAFTTVSDDQTGARIGRLLVETKIVACVNRVPGVVSTYTWKGAVHEDAEVLLIMKTLRSRVPELESELARLHPYEVPELVVVEAGAVGRPYAQWIRSAMK